MTSRTKPPKSAKLPEPASKAPLAIVAFGGNALIRAEQAGHIEEQIRNAERAVQPLQHLLRRGFRLLLVHGNGPQVGHELIRQEESATKIPPLPLDACVANTQGAMGYLLERAWRNLQRSGAVSADIATIVSLVEVDPEDPGFRNPTKPVGPFLTAYRARQLKKDGGKSVTEDAGRGWRVVVPSPRPLSIVGLKPIASLLDAGYVVIAGGGGGIPVHNARRLGFQGVEAVIDKDLTAALLGRELGASLMVILTAVPRVAVDFNTPEQRDLGTVTAEELRRYHHEGHFPPGSMGPKVAAALEFLAHGGQQCIITTAERLGSALAGKDGTRVESAAPSEDSEDTDGQLCFGW